MIQFETVFLAKVTTLKTSSSTDSIIGIHKTLSTATVCCEMNISLPTSHRSGQILQYLLEYLQFEYFFYHF